MTRAAPGAASAGLAGLAGLVFAASTPPLDLQPGILLGLAGFACAVEKSTRPALAGFCFGLAANILALRFVPDVMPRFTDLPAVLGWIALVLLSAAQALPWAFGAWVGASARRVVPGWLAFGMTIYVATFVPAIFPWTPAGGLARWPILLQSAELVGERGTSFLVALGCGVIGTAVLARRWRPFALGAAVFAVLLGYGALRMRAVDAARAGAPHATVALIEPDFDATLRWDPDRAAMMLDRLTDATAKAEADGADLTVWPESAYPYTLMHGTRRAPSGVRSFFQAGVHGPILTGAYLTKQNGLGTNSAILVRADGAIEPSYDKRHLLWFGETIPLSDVFPVLRDVFARGTGLEPGTESVRFATGNVRAAVLNCYEDTLPAAGREAIAVRPNLLVNVTNDAWFAGSAEGELHLRLATLRAVELRRDLVRAVNRGPTTWVDATGRVVERRTAPEGAGLVTLVAHPALLDGPPTLYARFGDAPLALLLIAALGLAALRVRATNAKRAPIPEGTTPAS